MNKREIGNIGESIAIKYIKKLGYKLLDKNYTTHLGEIDIIAQDKDYVVFIEVKLKHSDIFSMPSESVTNRKQHKYCMVATQYLTYKRMMHMDTRFDVIEVHNKTVNHIINAF